MTDVKSQCSTSKWNPTPIEVRFHLTRRFLTSTKKEYMKISEDEIFFNSPTLFTSEPHEDQKGHSNWFKVKALHKSDSGEVHSPYFITSTTEYEVSCSCTKLNMAIAHKCKISVKLVIDQAVFTIFAPNETNEKILVKSFKFFNESFGCN